MKKTGILNPQLCQVLAEMGHTDMLAIADAGLPIPLEARRVDLSLVPGIPPFIEVLRAVLAELAVEEVVLAREIVAANPEMHADISLMLGGVQIKWVSHAEFKDMLIHTKAVVRTGECTPYSNIILSSGVNGVFKKAR